MSEIPDQTPFWNAKHRANDHGALRGSPSPFARIAEPFFGRGSHILELGCGVGRDAAYFSSLGHIVTATDGSSVVIEQNRSDDSLSQVALFDVLDMRQRFPYANALYDGAYANLSLHYYSTQMTRAIVSEIKRVVRPGGVVAVACKSYDSMHAQGRQVAPDIYVSPNGQTIHLFTQKYMRELFGRYFQVLYLDEISETYKNRQSRIVRCVATINPEDG